MSNRDSMGFGELLPRDVVEIFAQERHSKRGRKKRSRSLGRAISWLKGKKLKKFAANEKGLGLGPALNLSLDGHSSGNAGGNKAGQKSGKQAYQQGNSHAVPKRHDGDEGIPAAPQIQENVFIEASRPKYLEDLHSEALEGLKMMQQEDTDHGVEYQDNESTISTMTIQTDGDGEGFMTDSTIGGTSSVVSAKSSVSTRSSRSGLTRQGSTFRPLKSGERSEKTKTRRRHRRTVVGIPRHVQKELGLDRVGWTLNPNLEEQLSHSETVDSPSSDGPESGPDLCSNVSEPISPDEVLQICVTHAGHKDDLALLQRLSPDLLGAQRPHSLAAPSMTTANSLQQGLPSPVMSISPQAAYMSKIIPNAVLPPSIEVVEISRGQSRNSLRTVSKASLILSSPASSRASSRASSSRTTSTRASKITSASRQDPHNLSESSCWSNSGSSDTLVSDSSTISSSSTPRLMKSQDEDTSAKEDKGVGRTPIGKGSKCTNNGKLFFKGDKAKREGPFVRSLSVIKHKRAPPPPSRSYSLHNKTKRRSRDISGLDFTSGESSLHSILAAGQGNENNKLGSYSVSSSIDSPSYNGDISSLDDSTGSASFRLSKSQLPTTQADNSAEIVETVPKHTPQKKQERRQENKQGKIISLSSGFSSQERTSPQLPKQPHSTSPNHKRGILAKLQRLFPGSAPCPVTQSGVNEKAKPKEDPQPDCTVDSVSISPSVRALRELFNIPPPPKVRAPPPPPPEVWAHSKRTIELLLGPPVPENPCIIFKKNPKDRRQQRQSAPSFPEGSAKSSTGERKQKSHITAAESINGKIETNKVQESGFLNTTTQNETNERLVWNVDMKENVSVAEKDEKVKVSDILNDMLAKAVLKRDERLTAIREEDAKQTQAQGSEANTGMDALAPISSLRISPLPSPLVHRPSQPPSTKNTKEKCPVSPELSWPPPPPPVAQAVTVSDDTDFPLPPPPVFSAGGLVAPVQGSPKKQTSTAANIGQINPSSIAGLASLAGKTETVKATKEGEPQQSITLHGTTSALISIPPPPSYAAPPPPVKEASPTMTKKVSPPPPTEVSQSPPEKKSPPPSKESDSLPLKDISPQKPKVSPPPLLKKVCPLPIQEDSPTPKEPLLPLIQVLPSPVKETSHLSVSAVSPTVKEVVHPKAPEISLVHAKECSAPSDKEVSPFSFEKVTSQSSEEEASVIHLRSPESIPPPPPPQRPEPLPLLEIQPKSSQQEIKLTEEGSPTEPETTPVSYIRDLKPPQSIPPPPPIESLTSPAVAPMKTQVTTVQVLPTPQPCESCIPTTSEPVPSPPVNADLHPPTVVQSETQAITETQTPTLPSCPFEEQEPAPTVSHFLQQRVKLRNVNSGLEPPLAREQDQAEESVSTKQSKSVLPTSSVSSEAPQKPIRRSLIMSPTSTSPPATVLSQPALSTSHSVAIPAESSSTVPPSSIKSPPAVNPSPSMNLQEAIRQRTAARSRESLAARLSMHSPTSPVDVHKSPTSTANFIFSKSNKKVVMETKPVPDSKETSPKIQGVSSSDVLSDTESGNKVVKMLPPVAKKPKSKAKETETSDGMEKTALQETQPENLKDTAEKTNGSVFGTAEGGDIS